MTPNIRGVLSTLLPGPDAEEIDIIANDVKFTDPEGKGNTWEIVFRHPTSGFGHDKSQAILPYRDLAHKPTLFFCGDGVSDLSAAKHADLLFAKTMESGHSDLQTYCEKQGIRHVPFVDLYVHPFFFFPFLFMLELVLTTFLSNHSNKVLEKVQEVVGGKSVDEVLKEEGQ